MLLRLHYTINWDVIIQLNGNISSTYEDPIKKPTSTVYGQDFFSLQRKTDY